MAREWLLCGNHATKMCLLAAKMLASYDADSVNQRPREVYHAQPAADSFQLPRRDDGTGLYRCGHAAGRLHHREPGFISKIWTENPRTGEAGGIYLFEDEGSALAYATMHEQRVLAMGASAVQYKVFDVNEPLSRVTKGIA